MREPGETARLVYDWLGEGPPPREGDVLQSRSGRRYLVVSAKRVKTRRSPSRQRIEGLVLAEGDGPEGPHRVYPLCWNARKRVR